MPFNSKDTATYRKKEGPGKAELTIEQRLNLLKPYLPTPEAPAGRDAKRKARAKAREPVNSRLGLRRFILCQIHLLTFFIIHTFFSLYIRLRQAFHSVRDRSRTVIKHHHHSPEIIAGDVKDLSRLPKHLSVILKLDESGRSGAELSKLVGEVSDIAAWCAAAGIPVLSVYEKTGILKNYIAETHRTVSEKLSLYFGDTGPALSLQAPHMPSIESASTPQTGAAEYSGEGRLSIILLSAEDGRDSLVDLTKTLAEMAQKSKISASDVSIDLIDAELSESVVGEPDLVLIFGPHVELSGYPPWQIRLSEIFHVPDNNSVGYQVFLRGLYNFAKAEMRMGR